MRNQENIKNETNKIKNNNLDKIILRLRKDGLSANKIREEILRETGVKLNINSIYNFLNKEENVKKELIQKDTELQKTARDLAINYKKEISSILDEVKILKNKALEEQDVQAFDKMVGRLFQGLELINKIVDGGGIKSQKVDINVIYQNIFEETHDKFKQLKNNILSSQEDVSQFIKNQDTDAAKKLNLNLSKREMVIDAEFKDVREIQQENETNR